MILSAQMLDEYDRCERRFAFNRRYEPIPLSPLGVLYAAVEAGIQSLDPEESAKAETMRLCSRRELILTELNKFTTVRHIGYLAGIISVALVERLGVMRRVGISTTEDFVWESGLFETVSGDRHRIELVSHWDDDRLRACAHSWRVIGELAALQVPLTLTTVIIGAQRGGRRHSEWTKGFLHPANRTLRFMPRKGNDMRKAGFNDQWSKVWREHQGEISTKKWLEMMRKDEVIDSLLFSREIAFNAKDHRMAAARREMVEIMRMMRSASKFSPMRRSSCDEFGGCPFQSSCYSPVGETPDMMPQLYRIRALDKPEAEPAECTSAHHISA